MPLFEYQALNKKGKKVTGLVTAEGPSAARLKMSQEGVFPVHVKEVKEKRKRVISRRINPSETALTMRQLATLASSGLPLVECITGVIDQTESPRLRRVFSQIKEDLLEGNSLAEAMSTHKAVFSALHINMVRAGERSGALAAILKRLADFSEDRVRLRKKMEAAMAYPIFLVMISSIILIFLMSFVMPKITGIFHGMELTLPWSTLFVIRATEFMRNYWWMVAGLICAAFAAGALWTRTDSGRYNWDRFRLWVPYLGRVHHKAVIARFTRTLSILLKSGITLVEALETARFSAGNLVVTDALERVARQVTEGGGFAEPLKQAGRFPPFTIQLIRAGEQSGELVDMLEKAAAVYEEDVETSMASFTALVEPLAILMMGAMVGFLVMAILLPIFDMTKAVQ